MFGNRMAIYYIMPQFIQNHSRFVMLMKTCMIWVIDLLKSVHIQCAWNPLWKCVSLWLSKSVGRYANIENNNDDDGDGDGDDDPCKNALTAPEPLLASAHSFSNISTILVLKNT